MAEITGQSLIQDWYDRYVLPKKTMKDAFSGVRPDFNLGRPPSTNPLGYRGPGITAPTSLETPAVAPIAPPEPPPEDQVRKEFNLGDAVGFQNYTPDPSLDEKPEVPAARSGWENLNEGLKDPAKLGVLGMGLSMMATPPRPVKYSGAEIIGRSGLAGLGIFEKALEAKRRQQALDVTTEEHRLAREDRRQANEERALYYRDRARIAAAEQESKDEARRATAAEAAALDVPIPESMAKFYNLPPTTTVRMFNKLEKGLEGMTKKDKEAAAKTQSFTDDEGNVHVVDVSKPGTYPGIGKKGKAGAGAKPSKLSEEMELAEQALQDEYQRNLTVPAHGEATAPPPMRKKFTTGEIAAKAEEMFGKKTAGKAGTAEKGQSYRSQLVGKGAVGKAVKKIRMADGSIREYDAAGNRIR